MDSLNRLRHDAVVRRNYKYCYVRHLGTAGTHCSESLMARRVEERNIALAYIYTVSADALRNAAGFGCGHVRVAYGVKQGSLAVVYVTHNNDYRRTRHKVFVVVFAVVDYLVLYGYDYFLLHFCMELHRNKRSSVEINNVVYRCKSSEVH